jgi:hypothetical protein
MAHPDLARPMVPLPDPTGLRLMRRFERGSMKYWEIVQTIMRLTGASREATERFICDQEACVE